MVSEAGKEQRRAWRNTPRRAYEFLASAITLQRFRSLKGFLAKTQGQVVVIPDIPRSVKSIGTSAGGSHTINVPPNPPSWIAEGMTAILIDGERVESRTIASIAVTTITFEEANTAPWPDYTTVAPGVQVRVASEQQTGHIVRGVTESSFTFTGEPCTEFEEYDEDPEATWNGREVFIRSCNWSNPQDLTFAHPTDMVDYDFGRVMGFQPIAFGSELRSVDYLPTTRDEVKAIVSFFRRARGRLSEFYVPTDESDIEVTSTVNTGATSITTPGTQLAEDYADSTVFKAISVKMADGRRFYRKVSEVQLVGGNSRVVLTAGVPYTLTPGTVEVISWLPLCRLASDDLTVVWVTDQVATIRMSFLSLEDEDPE
jgi:hypothetical protein